MSGRAKAQTEPAKAPAEDLRPETALPTRSRLRDPAFGIMVAIVCSALIWPVLFLVWLHLSR